MTKIHPIYQKELEAFEKKHGNIIKYGYNGEPDKNVSAELKSSLLASLQRASMAVVEASVGEEKKIENNHIFGSIRDKDVTENAYNFWNSHRFHTLATAREITGVKEE